MSLCHMHFSSKRLTRNSVKRCIWTEVSVFANRLDPALVCQKNDLVQTLSFHLQIQLFLNSTFHIHCPNPAATLPYTCYTFANNKVRLNGTTMVLNRIYGKSFILIISTYDENSVYAMMTTTTMAKTIYVYFSMLTCLAEFGSRCLRGSTLQFHHKEKRKSKIKTWKSFLCFVDVSIVSVLWLVMVTIFSKFVLFSAFCEAWNEFLMLDLEAFIYICDFPN